MPGDDFGLFLTLEEKKCPWDVGFRAEQFGVKDVAQPNEAASQSGWNNDFVQDPEIWLIRISASIK